MAKREVLVDDLDGSEEAVTVPFSIDGYEYEVDLSPENRDQLYGLLEKYMVAGRKITTGSGRPVAVAKRGATRPTKRQAARADSIQLEAVRKWARANGYRVADRGRVTASVMAAYQEAHGTPDPNTK